MSNFQLPLPIEVKEALEKLGKAGHEAWLVGGVRDLLLRREVHDWDLTTSATPEEIKAVFADYSMNLVGERFGTVTVHYGDHFLDITTFRKESEYKDHRHPSGVTFTKNLFEDLYPISPTRRLVDEPNVLNFHVFTTCKQDRSGRRRHFVRTVRVLDFYLFIHPADSFYLFFYDVAAAVAVYFSGTRN